ncbi:DUF1822 family protein [Leptolyngbya sp. FACHB-261]|uniref:DUF1822 family protein n=1 Tax=Leptolyngbya sp. FACHB-261 TaxID=2692806 RepID=UPI0016860594|nr:DUF1822 family protein [Leptolyngbya sp. FACHB-261]MBD2101054.1 DUF1822 family protein [Leptolyngbya sp. FACHB-261]
MTSDPALLELADPSQLGLELPDDLQEQAWQQSQRLSAASDRWNAYINSLCLNAFLPWLQEQVPEATVWPGSRALASIWQFTTGTAITLSASRVLPFVQAPSAHPSGERLVLIPSESIDMSELRVPQEWVDIPEWAADYYLFCSVSPDDGWMQVRGYTTHHQLKTLGNYDAADRTYSLDADALIADLNVLLIARQRCPEEVTRAAIAPLPVLPLAQAENLLQRLGNPSLALPRLAVPFTLWGALIAHGGWRQRLHERRQGLQEQWSILQWLQAGVSELAELSGWGRAELQANPLGSRGAAQATPLTVLSRSLVIAGEPYELSVLQGDSVQAWRFELRASSLGGRIPSGFKLRLLTEDLQGFENNETTATKAVEQLYVEVALEPGESLVWEVEPTPENYEREILRF